MALTGAWGKHGLARGVVAFVIGGVIWLWAEPGSKLEEVMKYMIWLIPAIVFFASLCAGLIYAPYVMHSDLAKKHKSALAGLTPEILLFHDPHEHVSKPNSTTYIYVGVRNTAHRRLAGVDVCIVGVDVIRLTDEATRAKANEVAKGVEAERLYAHGSDEPLPGGTSRQFLFASLVEGAGDVGVAPRSNRRFAFPFGTYRIRLRAECDEGGPSDMVVAITASASSVALTVDNEAARNA